MIRFMKLVLLIPIFSLLGGCWDRNELNDLAIITGLSLDKAENNQIQASVQVILPRQIGGSSSGGGGGGGGEGEETTVRSAIGVNTADALSKLQWKISRKLFWGLCNVFIFSDTLAKEGIQKELDFLSRYPPPKERGYLYVSKGKASDALNLFPPLAGYSGESLRTMSYRNIGVGTTMVQLNNMLKGESQAAILPIMAILPKDKTEKDFHTGPYIAGTAIFKKDKMIGEISRNVTEGVMLFSNKMGEFTLTFRPDNVDGLVSVRIIKGNVKLIPKIEDEKWKMTVKVQTIGEIIQDGTPLNPIDPATISKLDEDFEKALREGLQATIREAQDRLKVDIFNFAREFHRKYPKQWEKSKDHWDELFPKVEVNTEIVAHIVRTGDISSPPGNPKEEVK